METRHETLPRFEIRPLTDQEGTGYLVEFPDYPGCIADGETPEAALKEGRDALKSYIETLKELGRAVPEAGEVYGGQWRSACRNPCMQPLPDAPIARAFHSICWQQHCSPKG